MSAATFLGRPQFHNGVGIISDGSFLLMSLYSPGFCFLFALVNVGASRPPNSWPSNSHFTICSTEGPWPCNIAFCFVRLLARLNCNLLLYIRKFSQFSKYEPPCRPTNITSHYSPGTLAGFNCLSKVSARNIAVQSVYVSSKHKGQY